MAMGISFAMLMWLCFYVADGFGVKPSTSHPTTLRVALLNSTPSNQMGRPSARYLSA
jgi:hypothetical protein